MSHRRAHTWHAYLEVTTDRKLLVAVVQHADEWSCFVVALHVCLQVAALRETLVT